MARDRYVTRRVTRSTCSLARFQRSEFLSTTNSKWNILNVVILVTLLVSVQCPWCKMQRLTSSPHLTQMLWTHHSVLNLTQPTTVAKKCGPSVRENVCNNSKKRKKSCFLKSEKNVEKRRLTAYVQFHRPLNHSAFNTQLPKPKHSTRTGKSPTSHTLFRNADTRD